VLELGFGALGEGDPDVVGVSQGNDASAFFDGPPGLSNGTWFLAPRCAGRSTRPPRGRRRSGMLAHMKAFDRNADSTTGDWWRVLIDGSNYTPLQLGPGESGTMTVTFTPQGAPNERVRGVLYVDDFSFRTLSGNEEMAFPYSYRIK